MWKYADSLVTSLVCAALGLELVKVIGASGVGGGSGWLAAAVVGTVVLFRPVWIYQVSSVVALVPGMFGSRFWSHSPDLPRSVALALAQVPSRSREPVRRCRPGGQGSTPAATPLPWHPGRSHEDHPLRCPASHGERGTAQQRRTESPSCVGTEHDGTGPGALFLLRELSLGRTIRMYAGRATYSYVVAAVRTVPKADLPSLGVLDPLGPRRLVIVTCGGPFDRSTRRYLDNLVVYAKPAPRR